MLLGGIAVFAVGSGDSDARARLETLREEQIATRDRVIAQLKEAEQKLDSLDRQTAAQRARLDSVSPQRVDELRAMMREARRGAESDLARIDAEKAKADGRREKLKADLVGAGGAARTDVIARSEKATVVVITDKGSGSGFIVDAEGSVVTNYHVIAASEKVSMQIQKRDSREKVTIEGVEIVAADADRDLALLRIPVRPASVLKDGAFPTLPLRVAPSVRAGEEVLAIGNPGSGAGILDYSVTQGIVSNPRREGGKVELIQTSAPVNPGNSGGPLIDTSGRAVGVVALKGVDVEGVAFAIPSSAVKNFLERRKEKPFVVEGSFSEWEREHHPLISLSRRSKDYDESLVVKLGQEVDKMVLSADGETLYLMAGRAGKVREYLIRERRFGKTFLADTVLSDMEVPASGSAQIFLAAKELKAILRVDPTTMTLVDETKLASPPMDIAVAAGAGGMWVVAVHPFGESWTPTLVASRYFGSKEPVGVELSMYEYAATCACDGRRFCFVRRLPGSEGRRGGACEVVVVPIAGAARRLEELEKQRKKAAERGFPTTVVARIDSLKKRLAGLQMTHEISGNIIDARGPALPLVVFSRKGRFLFARRAFAAAGRLKLLGEFKPNPVFEADEEEAAKHQDFYRYTDNLFSVSRDGEWAASGTHIYDVGQLQPVRRLPFPTLVSAFSEDGKSIYLFDPLREDLYTLESWMENAAKPDG
jgi:S1-C subfamily serine protease